MEGEGVTKKLVEFAMKTSFNDIPKEVAHEAKRIILDQIGCGFSGYQITGGKIVMELIKDLGGKPEATVVGYPHKTSCVNAAFANGELMNIVDLDDVWWNAYHITPCYFPAALAMGERERVTGKDLITATVIGFEIATRLAQSYTSLVFLKGEYPNVELTGPSVYGFGFVSFAAAAAAGKLLGLDQEKMANAFGIAGYNSPVPCLIKWSKGTNPHMVKFTCVGWVASNGVMASLLAQKGFTGDTTVLDGPYGFWKMFGSTRCDWKSMTAELGSKWYITQTSYKIYPNCKLFHHSLDLFAKILSEHNLKAEDIKAINVRHHPFTTGYLWKTTKVETELAAQFSVPYAFACIANDVSPGPDWQALEIINNPSVKGFLERVEFNISAHENAAKVAYEQIGMEPKAGYTRSPTTVEIITTDRRKFSEYTEYSRGDPWTPETRFSDEELKEKFRRITSGRLCVDKIEKVIDMIFSLEEVEDINELTGLLSL